MRQGQARQGCELASQPASAASQQADLNIKHKTNEWCDGRMGRGVKRKKKATLFATKQPFWNKLHHHG